MTVIVTGGAGFIGGNFMFVMRRDSTVERRFIADSCMYRR